MATNLAVDLKAKVKAACADEMVYHGGHGVSQSHIPDKEEHTANTETRKRRQLLRSSVRFEPLRGTNLLGCVEH